MCRILAVVALVFTFGVAIGQTPNKNPRPLTQGSAGAASTINKIQNQGEPSGTPAEGRPVRKPSVYIDEEKSAFWHEKGKTAFNKKDYKAAVDHFTTAIHFNLKNSDSYAFRAKAYSLLKKHPEAIADCDKAIELGVMGPSIQNLRKLSQLALDNAK